MAEFDSGGEPVRKRHSEDYVAGGYCSFCLGHSHGASNCPNKPKPIATHDEVIAWIDSKIAKFKLAQRQSGDDSEHEWWEISIASLLANRAGLERHKEANGFCWSCHGIHDTGELFPCPTYTKIYDQIRSVM